MPHDRSAGLAYGRRRSKTLGGNGAFEMADVLVRALTVPSPEQIQLIVMAHGHIMAQAVYTAAALGVADLLVEGVRP